MKKETEISIRDFVGDIRGNLNPFQLMEKYDLSLSGLVQAVSRLFEANAMEPHELRALLPVEEQKVVLYEQRQTTRHFLHDRVLACDVRDPAVEGIIQNINEDGFQVKGIRSNLGETRDLLIICEDILAVRSFAVEVQCCWTQLGFHESEYVSGYRIKALSDKARTELRKLVLVAATALTGGATYLPRMTTEAPTATISYEDSFALIERPDESSELTVDVTESGSFDVRMPIEAFSAATNGFPMPCFLVNESFDIMFVNEFGESLGIPKDQFAGASFPAFFPLTADRVEFAMNQALSKRIVVPFAGWMRVGERELFVKLFLRAVRCEKQRLLLVTVQVLTAAVQKLKSTQTRVDELLEAYKEVLRNLATTETILRQRNEAMHLVIDSLGDRLKEERRHLILDLEIRWRPIINRLKDERMSERGMSLLRALENLLESMHSVPDYEVSRIYGALSPREAEVCDLILAGYGSKAMAEALGVSVATVTTHRGKIRKKLGLKRGQSTYNALRARFGRAVGLDQSTGTLEGG
jgi:DNA-binding CsgD family transcriptional regulator